MLQYKRLFAKVDAILDKASSGPLWLADGEVANFGTTDTARSLRSPLHALGLRCNGKPFAHLIEAQES